MGETAEHDYDVALSFAGEDRATAEKLAQLLTEKGIRVFYDAYEEAALWGKDLFQHLQTIYRDRAKFCVVFVSAAYGKKLWTKHELRQAQARAFKANQEYILPLRMDDTELPGLTNTTGYVDLRRVSIERVAELVAEKLGKVPEEFEEPYLNEVVKSVANLIEASQRVPHDLGSRLGVPNEGMPDAWERRIAGTMIKHSCYEVIRVLDMLHEGYCESRLWEDGEICIKLVNLILPATYDIETVGRAIDSIQEGEVMLVDLPIINETCAAIIMAGVDGFSSGGLKPRVRDFNPLIGVFQLPDPPEPGLDPEAKGFEKAWVDFIIEKFVSPDDLLRSYSDQAHARQLLIDRAARELKYLAEYRKCTRYYVIRHPIEDDRLGPWLAALARIKRLFSALVFINLCEENKAPDDAGHILRSLRDMYIRHQAKPKE